MITPTALVIAIHGIIGNARHGTTAAGALEQLAAGRNAETLILRINSTGGDVHEAATIFNAVRRHGAARKTSVIEGYADSSASWLALAADRVLIAPNATMTIHNPICPSTVPGATKEMTDAIASIYGARTGTAIELWLDRMASQSRFTATEVVELGLADGLTRHEETQ